MIKCPKCKFEFSLGEAFADSELRDIIGLLPRFEGHGKLVFEYCELFGVTPIRSKTKKLLRLLQEVSALYQSEAFLYQKKRYKVSKRGIMESLITVCNKEFSGPLQNHNYLKRVMIDVADVELKEGRERAEREQRKKEVASKQSAVGRKIPPACASPHADRPGPPLVKGGDITAEEFKRRKGIESLAERIGKTEE